MAALNFPFTAPPPKDLNGFMVPGFIPWRHLRRNTVPKGLYDRLKELPGFEAKELAWDFDQEKHWRPDPSTEVGRVFRALKWVYTVIGWFLSSLSVAALAGLIRRD